MKSVFIDANILIDYLSSKAEQEDRKWAMAIQDIQFAFDNVTADFEDAVQLSCASKVDAEFIVSRNIEDFYGTELLVIRPELFFDFI